MEQFDLQRAEVIHELIDEYTRCGSSVITSNRSSRDWQLTRVAPNLAPAPTLRVYTIALKFEFL